MAQRTAAAVAVVLPLPDGLDEVTAAAIINPGVGAWLALTRQAALQAAIRPSWTSSVRPSPSRSAAPMTGSPWPGAAGQGGIHVIIDSLWGRRTEAAITRRGLTHAAPRVRLVELGQMPGPVISLPAAVLCSSGLEVLGSGPGTIPPC